MLTGAVAIAFMGGYGDVFKNGDGLANQSIEVEVEKWEYNDKKTKHNM